MITVAVRLVVIGAGLLITGVVTGALLWINGAIVASLGSLVVLAVAIRRDHRARRGG